MFDIAKYLIGSAVLALVLTRVCRAVAARLGIVAKPKEDRWHQSPTPLLGGVAISVATLGIGLTVEYQPHMWELMTAAALIALFGAADDVLSLTPLTKLITQISVASMLLFFGFRLGWTDSLVGDAMLTLIWLVGVTNALNLLDNMDGLCAGTTLVAGVFLLMALVNDTGVTPLALYLAALLGATAGFLVYNISPASIFMGDAGSLFLGLNLAAMTVLARPQSGSRTWALSAVAAPVLLLLIPIFDTAFVTAVRLLSGRLPSQGGRDHTSHRLVAMGMSEKRAVATLWLLAGAAGVISVLVQTRDASWGIIAALALVVALAIFSVYLARIRVYEGADLAVLRHQALTPLVTDFMYKRRVAEVLLDMILIPLAYYTAYRLRFEGPQLSPNYPQFLQSLPVVLTAQLIALYAVGAYQGSWRHFGMMDAVVFAKGIVIGTVAAMMVILGLYRFVAYSRTVFAIDAVLLLLMLCVTRASFRLMSEFIRRRRHGGSLLVIYGVGDGAAMAVRELVEGAAHDYKLLGFVDDDPRLARSRMQGYPVLGDYTSLASLIANGAVDAVVVTTPLMEVSRLGALQALCAEHQVALARLHFKLDQIVTAS